MKKKLMVIVVTCMLLINTTSISQAAEWKQDVNGWKYQDDNGNYFSNGWKEIDGKKYYFEEDSYILTNTITPDFYFVDESGVQVMEIKSIINDLNSTVQNVLNIIVQKTNGDTK